MFTNQRRKFVLIFSYAEFRFFTSKNLRCRKIKTRAFCQELLLPKAFSLKLEISAIKYYAQMADTNDEELFVIDNDCGTDDAEAILFAIDSLKQGQLLGLTTVAGNIDIDNVIRNNLRLLHFLGREDVSKTVLI